MTLSVLGKCNRLKTEYEFKLILHKNLRLSMTFWKDASYCCRKKNVNGRKFIEKRLGPKDEP